MNYAVDRIVNGIVVLQNIDNGIMFEIEETELGFKVNDGDIVTLVNGKYILNEDEKEKRELLIKAKMNKAKGISE